MILSKISQMFWCGALALSSRVVGVSADEYPDEFLAPGGKYTLRKMDYYKPLDNFEFPFSVKNEWLYPREKVEWIRFIRSGEARVADRIIPVCNFHMDLEFFYERPDLNAVLTELLCGKRFRVYLTEVKYTSYAPDGGKLTPNEVVEGFIKRETPKLVDDLILYRYHPDSGECDPFRYVRCSRIFAPCGKFVSVALLNWDFTIGAYSNGGMSCFTLDTTTGNVLWIDDILVDGFEEKIKELGPWTTNAFYPDGVLLLPDGVLFVQNYNHYGFTCFFSTDEIRDLLRPEILAAYDENASEKEN